MRNKESEQSYSSKIEIGKTKRNEEAMKVERKENKRIKLYFGISLRHTQSSLIFSNNGLISTPIAFKSSSVTLSSLACWI